MKKKPINPLVSTEAKAIRLEFFFLATIFFGILALAQESEAATITASSCSLADVTIAYNASLAGDIIVFPASGACTWSSALTVSKAVTISGNGTTLTAGGAMPTGFFNITGFAASSLVRVTDFTFNLVNYTTNCAVSVRNMSGGVSVGQIRIDHNTIRYGYEGIDFYHGKGLIDNNHFYNVLKGIAFTAGSRENADQSWANLSAGTADALYIEDNHFIADASYTLGYSQEQIGTFNGGKLVMRHNEFDGDNMPAGLKLEPFMAHGSADGGCGGAGYWEASSCQRRGQSVIEFYNNVAHGKRIDFLFITRGSANLIFNNSIIGTVSHNPRIMLSEEEYISDNWSIHRIAWPAEDQVHNTFIWNNTYRGYDFNDSVYGYIGTYPTNYDCTGNGVPMVCCTGLGTGSCGDESKTTANPFLRQNRDYFLHAPCAAGDATDAYGNTCTHGKETFTGLNGGSAGYPTNGSVYPNLGNMIFTATGDNAYLDYSPFTYPHPLRGGVDIMPPAPPSGLAVN